MTMETKIVTTLVLTAASAMLVWAGANFKELPRDVEILKAQRVEDQYRLNRIENKLDKILDEVKRR